MKKYSAGPAFLQASTTASSSPTWSSIVRAKNVLKSGYSWRAGSGTSSFWFSPWSDFGPLGSLVPVIDIHDTHLTVKDVITTNGQSSQLLYTPLPPAVADFINNSNLRFNDAIGDIFIWHHNVNGTYTTKSGYNWLLSSQEAHSDNTSWTWIWKQKIPEKYKFFIWLIFHNSLPTLALLHHRNIAPTAICTRCGDSEESVFHCIRDCRFSKQIWQQIGFSDPSFFAASNVKDWIKDRLNGSLANLFASGLWWVWRYRNTMCLNDEVMQLNRLLSQIYNTAEDIKFCFYQSFPAASSDRHIRWNNENFDCAILNVDGSCIGDPIRAGFGGLIRNSAGFYLTGFAGFIPSSSDILEAESTAIFHGLSIATNMGITELVCYSDSLLSINLISGNSSKYHVHAVLIQDIKDKLSQANYSLHHTLREGNQCADFLAKLGASSDASLLLHPSPPEDLRPFLRNDASRTLFLRH